MDYGGEADYFLNLNDVDYRYELYIDWKNVCSDTPTIGKNIFCRNKGISLTTLERIIEEFEKPLK